jgi:hypothetical protein
MEARGHAINLEVSHRCLFCAEGQYKVLVNGLEGNSQVRGLDRDRFLSDQESPYMVPNKFRRIFDNRLNHSMSHSRNVIP